MDAYRAVFREPRQLISGQDRRQKSERNAASPKRGALLLQSVSELPRNIFIWGCQRPLRHGLAHGRYQDIVLLKPFERPRAIEIRQRNGHINQNAGVIANMNRAQGGSENILIEPSATNVDDLGVSRTEAAADIVVTPEAHGIAGKDLAIG
jgi:hypothetical protein